jgi:hypothetical protein
MCHCAHCRRAEISHVVKLSVYALGGSTQRRPLWFPACCENVFSSACRHILVVGFCRLIRSDGRNGRRRASPGGGSAQVQRARHPGQRHRMGPVRNARPIQEHAVSAFLEGGQARKGKLLTKLTIWALFNFYFPLPDIRLDGSCIPR